MYFSGQILCKMAVSRHDVDSIKVCSFFFSPANTIEVLVVSMYKKGIIDG